MSDQTVLPFTGERFTPECPREIFYEHWHRYALAGTLVDGLRVLDAACGEGYGSDMLARHAGRVDGVDLDEAAIEHARRRYRRDNLEFHVGNALALPFGDATFDAVVSFETLEHLGEQDELLSEFRRVLKPEGWLLISSPDKKTYSDDTGYRNEFHVRELYRDELEALLSRHFEAWRLCGQKLLFQSVIWGMEGAADAQHLIAEQGDVNESDVPPWPPVYYLAVCAADPAFLPRLPGVSLFGDREESVYKHYGEEIRRNIRARGVLDVYEQRIGELEARLKRPWWRSLLNWSRVQND